MDLNAKAQDLLETLANSIHDREAQSLNSFSFTIAEIHITEKWLREFIKELQREAD